MESSPFIQLLIEFITINCDHKKATVVQQLENHQNFMLTTGLRRKLIKIRLFTKLPTNWYINMSQIFYCLYIL